MKLALLYFLRTCLHSRTRAHRQTLPPPAGAGSVPLMTRKVPGLQNCTCWEASHLEGERKDLTRFNDFQNCFDTDGKICQCLQLCKSTLKNAHLSSVPFAEKD